MEKTLAKLSQTIGVREDPESEFQAAQHPERHKYERFAIPYSFKPRLSITEALIAASTTFLRIFLGCVLFAFWGVYTFRAYSSIPNLLVRSLVLLVLIGFFLAAMTALMLAITALTKWIWPRAHRHT